MNWMVGGVHAIVWCVHKVGVGADNTMCCHTTCLACFDAGGFVNFFYVRAAC